MAIEVRAAGDAPAGPNVQVPAQEEEPVVALVVEDGGELRERAVD